MVATTSELQKLDLVLFYFISHFYFIFELVSIFGPRIRS